MARGIFALFSVFMQTHLLPRFSPPEKSSIVFFGEKTYGVVCFQLTFGIVVLKTATDSGQLRDFPPKLSGWNDRCEVVSSAELVPTIHCILAPCKARSYLRLYFCALFPCRSTPNPQPRFNLAVYKGAFSGVLEARIFFNHLRHAGVLLALVPDGF